MCENAPENAPTKWKNVEKGSQKVMKMLKNGVPGAPRVPEVPKTPKRCQKGAKSEKKLPPFWELFGHLFGVFFFRASGTLKKGVGSAFKTRPLFLSILGSGRRASGGFPSRRELSFHFCSRSQKGLQNESQNGAFAAPKSPLYSLWGTLWEKWVAKKGCQKKVAIFAKNPERFGWGQRQGVGPGA